MQGHLIDTKAMGEGNPQIEAKLTGTRVLVGRLDICGLTHVGKPNLVEHYVLVQCLRAPPIMPLT